MRQKDCERSIRGTSRYSAATSNASSGNTGSVPNLPHAYEPKDDYYLGWTAGPLLMDDPFTIQDDIDRAHIGLGFAVAFAHLILDSYGAIFGSRWLWYGLQESELTASVALLQGLATRDTDGVMSRMQALGRVQAADSVRALVKLDLVVIDKGRPKLSMKGREFLDLKALQ